MVSIIKPLIELISYISSHLVISSAYLFVFIAVFIVARMLMQEQDVRAAQENLADLRNRKASNPILKLTRPFFTQYVVPIVQGKPFWDTKRVIYKRKIVSAGLTEELTTDEFIAFKLFLIVFFPIVGGLLKAGDFLDIAWYVDLGTGGLGWFYPNFWVNGRVKSRQKKVLRAMPFVVDLLALSMEAGLDFLGAIGKVVEKATPSPLIDELSQLLKETKLVGSSRQQALREMAIRIDLTEMNSFVSILISADEMGASIGKILRQQSEQIRTERMVRAEKEGAKAAQKILLPLVGLIMPAVMLMIFAPVILGFMYPEAAQ